MSIIFACNFCSDLARLQIAAAATAASCWSSRAVASARYRTWQTHNSSVSYVQQLHQLQSRLGLFQKVIQSASHPIVGSEIALALPINMHMDDDDGDRELKAEATDLSIHYLRCIRSE